MKEGVKCLYLLRPYYGVPGSLIMELHYRGEDIEAADFLIKALGEINARVIKSGWVVMTIVDAEYETVAQSDYGEISINMDSWGFNFVTASEKCLRKIDKILQKNSEFEKEEVDESKYLKEEFQKKVEDSTNRIFEAIDDHRKNNEVRKRFSANWSGDGSLSNEYWLFADVYSKKICWTFDMDEQWAFDKKEIWQSTDKFLEKGAPEYPFPDSMGRGKELEEEVRKFIKS